MGYFFAKKKKLTKGIILLLILFGAVWFLGFKKPESRFSAQGGPVSGWASPEAGKRVGIFINRLDYGAAKTQSGTVADFLAEQKITLNEKDQIWPPVESKLYSGSIIRINQARRVSFLDRDQTTEGHVLGLTVKEALGENNIVLGEDDFVAPDFGALAREGEKIKITRVEIREEKEIKNIDFKKVTKEDDKLGWREKKISQAGKPGKKELTFRAVYHNNKLISRKLLGEKVLEEPTEEISTQGTYMKLGKAKTGQASHYAASWGNLNASRDIPRGGYAKVTNLENGKSVVVKINDFGPISKERIIDLNYESFVQLANSWQGIIPRVKVEQVLN